MKTTFINIAYWLIFIFSIAKKTNMVYSPGPIVCVSSLEFSFMKKKKSFWFWLKQTTSYQSTCCKKLHALTFLETFTIPILNLVIPNVIFPLNVWGQIVMENYWSKTITKLFMFDNLIKSQPTIGMWHIKNNPWIGQSVYLVFELLDWRSRFLFKWIWLQCRYLIGA